MTRAPDYATDSCECTIPVCDKCFSQHVRDGILEEVTMTTEQLIEEMCVDMCNFLKLKNKAYGDSALNPVRIFSKADEIEQIKVRIDDKLNRLMQGKEYTGDDTVKDLTGYLILLMVASKSLATKSVPSEDW